MEKKSSNKKIGVGFSVAVLVMVVLVTAFLGKDSASQQVASSAQSSTPANTNQNTNSKSSTTDDEGNNDSTASENSENQVPVQSTTKTTTQNTNTAVDTTKKVASAYVYKNGTYTATGSYMSPGGYDQLGVTITVKNDVVTDTSVQLMAGDHTSSRYQQMFADNYKQYVVGQNLSGLNVGKVSRSSLTPEGFNDALNQIRSQAKA